MFRLRDGTAVALPPAFIQRCATLRELRGECGADGGEAPLAALDAATLTLLLAADAAAWGGDDYHRQREDVAHAAVAAVVRGALLRDEAWDTAALASAVDGANFLGHAALHAALCAALAADVKALRDAAALRERLRLPADLSAAAERAVRDALTACTTLPLESLCDGGSVGASSSPLACLAHDSLLLVFLYLPHDAVPAAALSCAAWAYAGLHDAATRLSRECAFMRDIYCNPRAAGGAAPPASHGVSVAARHVRLATGCGSREDAEALLDACVAAVVDDGGVLSAEQLSFATCALRTAWGNEKRDLGGVYDAARARVLAGADTSARRCAREAADALERATAACAAGNTTGAAAAALADADAALARHVAAVVQLRLLAYGTERGQGATWAAPVALAAITRDVLATPLAASLDAAAAAAAEVDDAAAAVAVAALREAMSAQAAEEPVMWLLHRRDGVAGADPELPPLVLIVDAVEAAPSGAKQQQQQDGAAADAAADAAVADAVAAAAPPPRLHAPAPARVDLPACLPPRCDQLVLLCRACAALHPPLPPNAPLTLRVPSLSTATLALVCDAAMSIEDTAVDDHWPPEHSTAFTEALDQGTLFEVILAADRLGFKDLVDVTCLCVANMIKGKTPEEIRRTFNIANDFTPEEEEEIRLENQWAFE